MPQPVPLIILGSAREKSDTKSFIDYVFGGIEYNLADLLTYNIAPYNYNGKYPDSDNFNQLAEELLNHHIIIFATPVYWYSMSGLMKNLFDRFTDLVRTDKKTGRKLKDKNMFLLSVGSNAELPEGFCVPFINTADYLDMNYRASIYFSVDEPVSDTEKTSIRMQFLEEIKKAQCAMK